MIDLPFLSTRADDTVGDLNDYQGYDRDEYHSLGASWLIRMALFFGWPQSLRHTSALHIADADAFQGYLGLPDTWAGDKDDPGEVRAERAEASLRRQLASHEGPDGRLDPDSPLFRNIELLDERLELSDADKVLLVLAALIECEPAFEDTFGMVATDVNNRQLAGLLRELSGVAQRDALASVEGETALVASGVVRVQGMRCPLEAKISLVEGLADSLFEDNSSIDDIVQRFGRVSPAPKLGVGDFPHLRRDAAIITDYLVASAAQNTPGCNVLLHGEPGLGKTEFARAVAQAAGLTLYEVPTTTRAGVPLKASMRLRAFKACQRLLAGRESVAVLFDDCDDALAATPMIAVESGDDDGTGSAGSKAWINELLESNTVPCVWVANDLGWVDSAHLRRFDYPLFFRSVPPVVRRRIAEAHMGGLDLPHAVFERVVANEHNTPAAIAKAARVAGRTDAKAVAVENVLRQTSLLLGGQPAGGRRNGIVPFDLSLLNANRDLVALRDGLIARPSASLCFYGPPGTGKTAFARHLAESMGREVMVRRASSILGSYVGETERSIAAMFMEAAEMDAVLVLDEADSFLGDRRGAHQQWEVTQVNELLTQMEAFEGVFIATTNLKSNLDPASMRRFALKLRFDPLAPGQRERLFDATLAALGGEGEAARFADALRQLDALTPGDFEAVAQRLHLLGEPVDGERLYRELVDEVSEKGGTTRPVGFTARL
ncbi:AAA family ATPase [Arhodomonas sp. KWT2]